MSTQPTIDNYIKLLKDADATVRAQAIEKLAELDAKQAVEPLIEIFKNYRENFDLRHQAILAVGKIGWEDKIQYFIKLLFYYPFKDTYWDFPSDDSLSDTAST